MIANNKQKKLLAGALGCLLACTQPAGYLAAAVLQQPENQVSQSLEADTAEDLPDSPEDLKPDYNDPDYVKRLIQQGQEEEPAPFSIRSGTEKTTTSPFTGRIYTHDAKFSDSEIINGIDVSMWQAAIDWQKVKAAGVQFVFIRCGYTSLSSAFLMHDDPYFRQNIQGAYNAGINVGIYFFSNSKTTGEAQMEAQKTLELIGAYKDMITLPVVYDFEAFSNAYRAYGLPKSQVTQNALTYMKIIQDAGYTPMYYSSPSFVDTSFDVSQLGNYNFWLAHYTTKSYYTGDYMFWQYSSTGQVNGISGNVDCDFYYAGQGGAIPQLPPAENLNPVSGLQMTDHTSSSITISWKPAEGADGYIVYQSEALGGTYRQIADVSGTTVKYKDTSVVKSEGRQYYYKVRPYVIEDSVTKYGGESDILTAYTKRNYKHRLKTLANVNLRAQAGTEYAKVAVVPSGTGLTFFKHTMATTGKKWYKVTYVKNGKSYTGYLASGYVKTFTYGDAVKNVNMRGGGGLSYKIKNVVPKGTRLTILNRVIDASGTDWSQVQYKKNGKTIKGYIPTKYIDRI